jgi:anti-sigma factor RsiW
MLQCTEIQAKLSDYLDRDLPPSSCAELEVHLEQCPHCRAATEALRQTVALCRQFRADDRPTVIATQQKEELRAALSKALATLRETPRDSSS